MLHTFSDVVQGRDVIFFIDNQSVCAALAKGATKSDDLQAFTTAWHARAHKLGVRVWFEWVDSKSNPADELSRWQTSIFTRVVKPLILPKWAVRSRSRSLRQVLDLV